MIPSKGSRFPGKCSDSQFSRGGFFCQSQRVSLITGEDCIPLRPPSLPHAAHIDDHVVNGITHCLQLSSMHVLQPARSQKAVIILFSVYKSEFLVKKDVKLICYKLEQFQNNRSPRTDHPSRHGLRERGCSASVTTLLCAKVLKSALRDYREENSIYLY